MTQTNPKQCMVVALRSERELDDSTKVKRQAEIETKEKNVETEKEPASAEMNQEEIKVDNT